MRSFRGLRYFLAPPWLTGRGDGEKIAFTLEWLLDAFLEKVRQGLNARFPTRAGPSALNLIIGDRGLLRGRDESAASIASRLLAWRTPRTHRVRGNAYEALLQIWHYWGGIYAATIDAHGLRHHIAATDTPDVDTLDDPEFVSWMVNYENDPYQETDPAHTSLWDGTDPNVHWSRFWLVLQPTAAMAIEASPEFGDAALWGGAIGTPGYLLGQVGATAEDVSAMRVLFQELEWNPAHTLPEWLLLCLDTDVESPVPAPDGGWLYWSKDDGGTRVAARVQTTPEITVGTSDFANGADTLTPTIPVDVPEGALLFLHEARAAGAFDALPLGWTLVSTISRSRVAVRNALATADEATDPVSVVVTGADDHVAIVSAVAPPGGGWAAHGPDNVGAAVTDSATSSSIELPAHVGQRARLAFVEIDFFDVATTVSGGVDYGEVYDEDGEINVSLHVTAADSAGENLTATNAGTWTVISFPLVYATAWRFWSLDPARNNTYTGLRTREWPAATTLPGGSVYSGDRSNAPAWGAVLMPDGTSEYTGVRTSFPAGVLLPDDGSVIR